LWHAREEIAANSRRKDDFLATLGHELRNPLSAITAAGSILQGRRTSRTPAGRGGLQGMTTEGI
ncbi:MAG: histidine kinase dimerization/phospho-acceptor domain-containing protein, partial [Vicinamibacterales bacterium]